MRRCNEADWRLSQESQRRGCAFCARLGAQPALHLCGHGGAGLWRGVPPGDEGQGRRGARARAGSELRGREADYRRLRVCGGRAALAVQADDRLCGHHRVEVHGAGHAARRRQPRRADPARSANRNSAFSAPRSEVRRSDSGGHAAEERVSTRFLFCLEEANLRKDAGEGMEAVDAYRQIQADNARPGLFRRCADGIGRLWAGRRAARPATCGRGRAGL